MRTGLRLLAALIVSAAAHVAAAAEPVPAVAAQVRQRMADAAVVRGEFEQRKTLKAFRNPLVSRGTFLASWAPGSRDRLGYGPRRCWAGR